MFKLGEALGGWTPRTSANTDPLAVVRGAWSGIVGVDSARAAQPVAIAGDALVVVTTSSAWSHQLAFLEPEILRVIRTLPGAPPIVRLRFRVGTIRAATARGKVANAVTRARATTRPAPPAPKTIGEALARLRSTIERTRAQHAASGGSFCATCAAAVDGPGDCEPCRQAARRGREFACERLLFEAPWLPPESVMAMVEGLDASAYDAIRRRLLRAWWDEMALARKRASLPRPPNPDRMRLRKIASSYVLLETKIDPNRLEMDSPVRRNALGDLYEFIRSVEQES